MKKKLYEVESNRYFKSVKSFFEYCVKLCEKHNVKLTEWIESLEQFENPSQRCNDKNNHNDWEQPQKEICKMQPYEWQLFLQDNYNFIMEFDFTDESSGHGYLYLMEYQR